MIGQSAQRVQWRALQAYIVALPFMVITRLPVFGSKLQPADLIFLVSLGAMACSLWQQRQSFRLTPVGCGAVVLGCVGMFSAICSRSLYGGMAETMAWWDMGLLYLLVVNTVRTWKQWHGLLELWVIVSTVVASLGIIGVMLGTFGVETPLAVHYPYFFAIRPHPFWVGTATFFASPTPNMVYGYLHAGTLLGIGLLCSSARRWPRAWYVSALILHLAAIVLSFSRGWVALLAAAFVFLWQFHSWFARLLGYAIFTGLILLAAWVGLLSTYNITHVSTDVQPVQRAPSAAELDRYYPYLQPQAQLVKELHVSVTYAPFMRPFLHRAALQVFKEHPWLGVGPGEFALEIYRRQAEQGADWGGLRVPTPWDPHSTYFGALAETGVVGCAAVLFTFAGIIWQLVRTLKTRPPTDYRVLVWAVLGCLIGYLVFAVDDDMLTKRWFWFTAALSGSAFALSIPRRVHKLAQGR